jgi:hypothetical protein
LSRRLQAFIAVLVCALCAAGVSSVALAANPTPGLKASKARSLVLKYARQKADAENFGEDAPHGVPSNWGAVKAADCKRQKGNVVACAFGLFWADGHECFNLRQVTAKFKIRNGRLTDTIVYTQKNLQTTTCDDEGSGNGGASGRGTATDIDPSGDGPLGPADDEDGEPAP